MSLSDKQRRAMFAKGKGSAKAAPKPATKLAPRARQLRPELEKELLRKGKVIHPGDVSKALQERGAMSWDAHEEALSLARVVNEKLRKGSGTPSDPYVLSKAEWAQIPSDYKGSAADGRKTAFSGSILGATGGGTSLSTVVVK